MGNESDKPILVGPQWAGYSVVAQVVPHPAPDRSGSFLVVGPEDVRQSWPTMNQSSVQPVPESMAGQYPLGKLPEGAALAFVQACDELHGRPSPSWAPPRANISPASEAELQKPSPSPRSGGRGGPPQVGG